MAKQIMTRTAELEDGGLVTSMFFEGGVSADGAEFHQIDVVTQRIELPNQKPFQETTASGRDAIGGLTLTVYGPKDAKNSPITEHNKAINYVSSLYLHG